MSVGAVVASKGVEKIAENKATPYVIGAVALVSIGVVVWGGSKIFGGWSDFFNGIKDSFGIGDDDEDEIVDRNDEILDGLQQEGIKKTLSNAQLVRMKDALIRSIDGWGNDAEAVARVFDKVKNIADVRALISVFGVEDGDTLGQWLNGDFINKTVNPITLSDGYQISVTWMVTLTPLVNKILEHKGLDFRFE